MGAQKITPARKAGILQAAPLFYGLFPAHATRRSIQACSEPVVRSKFVDEFGHSSARHRLGMFEGAWYYGVLEESSNGSFTSVGFPSFSLMGSGLNGVFPTCPDGDPGAGP